MIKQKSDNFLACKKPLDGMWSCYTEGKYGNTIDEAPEYTNKYKEQFFKCLFRESSGTEMCMVHFQDMVRAIYRSGEVELCDWY